MALMGTKLLMEASPRLTLARDPFLYQKQQHSHRQDRAVGRPLWGWCSSPYRTPGLSPMGAGPLSISPSRTADPQAWHLGDDDAVAA